MMHYTNGWMGNSMDGEAWTAIGGLIVVLLVVLIIMQSKK
ncbi:hypothetical protein GALL_61700 [mine drainage metagenome]|uniref:Uncharacterized protein n=1 Tax=mine drainage metagenome TaxID=410659 RepID=A0A1J5SVH1_9ZZZZ